MTLRFGSKRLPELLASNRLRQIGSLYVSFLINMAVGFVTSVLNTRILGPEVYGDLRFVNGTYQFLAVIATFGLFVTGSQLLAAEREHPENRRGLIGALLIISWAISALFIIITTLFALAEPLVFHNHLTLAIIVFSPLLSVWIFQPCIEMILQGENEIHLLSLFRVLPGIAYMVLLILFNLFTGPSLIGTLLAQTLSGILTTWYLMRRLKPDYRKFRLFVKTIWEANKVFGRHVYVGVLAGVATAYMSTFMISYYLDNTNVGFFSLALTLAQPLIQISSVVGTTYFKEFAQSDHIPGKLTATTGTLTLLSIIAFVLLVKPLVLIVYSEKFIKVASLCQIMALGAGFYGMGDYFNRFLGAHGRGKELRNGAIAVGTVNVLGYVVLVKVIGIDGAAITRLLVGTVYVSMMIHYYRKFRKSIVAGSAVPLAVGVNAEPAE
jgi:O-antigen/teichoic acid export membrane protein